MVIQKIKNNRISLIMSNEKKDKYNTYNQITFHHYTRIYYAS